MEKYTLQLTPDEVNTVLAFLAPPEVSARHTLALKIKTQADAQVEALARAARNANGENRLAGKGPE